MSEHRIINTNNTTPVLGEPEPIKPRSLWQNVFRGVVALLFVLAMVYLYGAQQFVQFHRTPTDSEVGTYEPLIEAAESITVPTRVFVITEDDGINTGRVTELVGKANEILVQASVALEITAIEPVTVPDGKIVGPQLVSDQATLAELLPPLADDQLHIVVVETLGGINGIAFSGQRLVAVAEYTTGFDFRILAHEVGHALSLRHVDDRGNLMFSGSSGTELTREQAREAYEAVASFE